MMDVEAMVIDGADERKPIIGGGMRKKPLKRKRLEPCLYAPCAEEKLAKISEFRNEVNSLVKYCKDLASENRGGWLENVEKVGTSSASLRVVIACLMEESHLPLSKLIDEIFEKVKGRTGNGDCISKATVKSIVLIIGKRSCYGVKSVDADILEDEDECSLWCWETRDLKLIPKSVRVSLKVRRTCRRKIQERIMSVSAMINALEKSENNPNTQQELVKASEKLSKVLNESDIRLLMESMRHKNGVEMDEKEAEREEKILIKQMETKKKEMERERKKKDHDLQLEKLRSEKELKLLHDEAEKEERRLEKEEIDIRKQLKRQQKEAEKYQRLREKEAAELKERLVIQKQASLMERFLKRSKTNSFSQNGSSVKIATISSSSSNVLARTPESVALAMDSVFGQNDGIKVQDLWKSHLNAWRSSRSEHSNRKRHWGVRQKPKTELIKELKLTAIKELACEEDFSMEKLVTGWEDSTIDRSLSLSSGKKHVPVKQLLQFDKSNRPAFYGVWPRKSQVVGARRPFVKDPDIEYDIDSDEEWEEDEPGESLSDSDKDDGDDDENIEEHIKVDDGDEDGDESEDGFFVPDGYLSENEGATADSEDLDLVEAVKDPSTEICTLLRQQKYLNSFTEHALRKNQPLIILNLAHDKTTLLSSEEITGIAKLENIALQTLSLRPFPGSLDIEISVPDDVVDEDRKASSSKSSASSLATGAALLDSDLPQIVSIIQSSARGIGKIEKSLRSKFPAVPRSQLRNKVREICEFSDNRWQVKKEILSKHGMNISPEKSCLKMKSIESFLGKRCHPPSGETKNTSKSSPQSTKKPTANAI